MTCKDCYHYEICELKDKRVNFANGVKDLKADGFKCFKDSSKIVELPCKVGDIVYFFRFDTDYYTEVEVRGFEIEKNKTYFIFEICGINQCVDIGFLNDRIFLTKEAAGQALREREQ